MDLQNIVGLFRNGVIKVDEIYGLYKELESFSYNATASTTQSALDVINSTAAVIDSDVKALPAPKWLRYCFCTREVNDPRPLIFNPRYPWWISGSGSYTRIVAYLPKGECLSQYWDDAFDVRGTEENKIEFTDRFPKPDYFIEEGTS